MQKLEIKKYKSRDFDYCMEIFELNCPKYFAESEREDCKKYLSSNQDHYLVGLFDKKKDTITISTSQYAKSFFEKHGAVMISLEKKRMG